MASKWKKIKVVLSVADPDPHQDFELDPAPDLQPWAQLAKHLLKL
jgi:hypothetical protein